MVGFQARALWLEALADPPARAHALAQAVSLARTAGERPLLRALLAADGSDEADQVTSEIAATIPDSHLQESFRAKPPL